MNNQQNNYNNDAECSECFGQKRPIKAQCVICKKCEGYNYLVHKEVKETLAKLKERKK